MKKTVSIICVFVIICLMVPELLAQKSSFNGLNMNMGNLYRLSNAKTRSISAENFTGEKGKGGKSRGGN